ncbi:carbohydrate ABC transporter permease [Paenibacillus thalictri]|nr:carbohydrate ABC transporter permease [Paenibacillus thalictri]
MNSKTWSGTLTYLLLAVTSAIVFLPFYWMLTNSLKDRSQIFMFPPQWYPHPLVWSNFADLFKRIPFHQYYFNSIYIAVIVTIGTCFFASISGYAFAKLHFRFKDLIFLMLLSSMMIPTEATVIPLFIWLSKLGMVNTHFPLIVPQIFGSGGIFGIFLFRQFYITLPDELMEAAKMDGCNPWQTFVKVMMPLGGPMFATLSIYSFLNSWNDFFEPLIFINSDHLYTIPLAMSMFTDQSGTEWHLLMAAAVLAALPLLLVFVAAQKRFIEGIAMTGMK